MLLPLDPTDARPLHQQIAAGVIEAIGGGAFAVGDALPSVRGLGADLRVNYHTVARAYQALEEAGWIERRRGEAFRVARSASEARAALLESDLDALCRRAEALGLDEDATAAALAAAWTRRRAGKEA